MTSKEIKEKLDNLAKEFQADGKPCILIAMDIMPDQNGENDSVSYAMNITDRYFTLLIAYAIQKYGREFSDARDCRKVVADIVLSLIEDYGELKEVAEKFERLELIEKD